MHTMGWHRTCRYVCCMSCMNVGTMVNVDDHYSCCFSPRLEQKLQLLHRSRNYTQLLILFSTTASNNCCYCTYTWQVYTCSCCIDLDQMLTISPPSGTSHTTSFGSFNLEKYFFPSFVTCYVQITTSLFFCQSLMLAF